MIIIRQVRSLDGRVADLAVASTEEKIIEGKGLIAIPALIDPHVHFRVPGLAYKEDWGAAAQAAIAGGITTVFDMPNTIPSTITLERVEAKKQEIAQQLHQVGIPLRFGLYLGADNAHFQEIARCKHAVVGLKVFMGSSTGELLMDDESSLHAAFSLAAAHHMLLAVHAEDEALIQARRRPTTDPKDHSEIRSEEAAIRATEQAIALARLYGTRLYILHVSTAREVELIRRAKIDGVAVFAEVTPHHLFLTTDDYASWGTQVQMNPPLRSQHNQDALWEGIRDGVIDTIGSDHAPHTLEEKKRPYGKAPSGIPGVETTLPLLLDACNKGKITLQQIVRLMRGRIQEIFHLPPNDDLVLIDLNAVKTVEDCNLKTKCGWSPYSGRKLQGWPVMVMLEGKVYA